MFNRTILPSRQAVPPSFTQGRLSWRLANKENINNYGNKLAPDVILNLTCNTDGGVRHCVYMPFFALAALMSF